MPALLTACLPACMHACLPACVHATMLRLTLLPICHTMTVVTLFLHKIALVLRLYNFE